MYLIYWHIRDHSTNGEEADRVREAYKSNYSKIKKIYKDFELTKFDNLGLIYLIINTHNNEDRNEARIKATEYWLQLKSLIDELKNYSIPHITDPNITDSNHFNEIRFSRKKDGPISIKDEKLIFNLVYKILPFLEEQVNSDSYEEMLKEITPYVGLKNAPDGFRIYRDKLIFSINNYLEAEEAHLKFQTKRSRIIKELFNLTDYPINISLRSIEKRIKRDK